jgi:hypothetical protein
MILYIVQQPKIGHTLTNDSACRKGDDRTTFSTLQNKQKASLKPQSSTAIVAPDHTTRLILDSHIIHFRTLSSNLPLQYKTFGKIRYLPRSVDHDNRES